LKSLSWTWRKYGLTGLKAAFIPLLYYDVTTIPNANRYIQQHPMPLHVPDNYIQLPSHTQSMTQEVQNNGSCEKTFIPIWKRPNTTP
jgi:hypothetical protein